jgi:hypothetical protein
MGARVMLRIKILFFLHWMRGGGAGIPISVLCKYYCKDPCAVRDAIGGLEVDGLVDYRESKGVAYITREGSEAVSEIIFRPQKGRSARKWVNEVRSGWRNLKGLAAIPRTLEVFEHETIDMEALIDAMREVEHAERD